MYRIQWSTKNSSIFFLLQIQTIIKIAKTNFVVIKLLLGGHRRDSDVSHLGHSQYILWATSPLMRWNCPLREKKPDIWVLSYFFLRHAEKRAYFSAQIQPKFSKCLRQEKKLTPEVLFIFSSNKAQKPLPGSIAHRIYREWPYLCLVLIGISTIIMKTFTGWNTVAMLYIGNWKQNLSTSFRESLMIVLKHVMRNCLETTQLFVVHASQQWYRLKPI